MPENISNGKIMIKGTIFNPIWGYGGNSEKNRFVKKIRTALFFTLLTGLVFFSLDFTIF